MPIMRDEKHEIVLSDFAVTDEPKPGDMDKFILVTGHHPDEATIELSVFRPEPQTIVLLKAELPFVIGALQDLEKLNHREPQ